MPSSLHGLIWLPSRLGITAVVAFGRHVRLCSSLPACSLLRMLKCENVPRVHGEVAIRMDGDVACG